jgi:dCTP diphosphatase
MDSKDSSTSVQTLRQLLIDFVEERDWNQFHSPKNLSMSIGIEAAELMEHFQWMDAEASRQLDEAQKLAVGEELADVLSYALALANQLGLDVTTAVVNKMEKNRKKYPIDQFRGRYRKP